MPFRLSTLIHEPLIYFLTIGALIYLLYGLFSKPGGGESDNTITITAGEIDWLETSWKKRWMRAPTPQERQGLIDAYVKERVMSREAIAMGLDRDDTIIRRRLAQKLEFLTQDLVKPAPPAEEDLKAYFITHTDRYQPPDLITLTHIFIDPDKRGDQTLRDAEEIKVKLKALGQPTEGSGEFGDLFMLQRYYPERAESEISKLFGREFARAVFGLSPGQWHGPILSGYGVHLVYVHHRKEAPPVTFAAVQDRVRQDWESDKRRELNDKFIANLLARYDVIIEDQASDGESAAVPEQPQ